MSSIITVGTLLAQFAMVAIGTYMFFYSGLIQTKREASQAQKTLDDLQRRLVNLEADDYELPESRIDRLRADIRADMDNYQGSSIESVLECAKRLNWISELSLYSMEAS